jgi:isocitrate dehydrogenase kinase/phosphatase
VTTSLDALLDLTDRVQAAIDAGDWQQANELESERRAQLERLVAEQTATDVRSVLDALSQRTHRLIGLVEHHRRRVLREATTVTAGHAAAARYVENIGKVLASVYND